MIARLFLEKDCPHCGIVRAALDMDAVVRDEFRGKAGQELLVFSALSNQASKELLSKFGLAGKFMPILQTHEGIMIDVPADIVAYLKVNGMAVR
jgi:hypothetical protein